MCRYPAPFFLVFSLSFAAVAYLSSRSSRDKIFDAGACRLTSNFNSCYVFLVRKALADFLMECRDSGGKKVSVLSVL